jgi:hypothetical protein
MPKPIKTDSAADNDAQLLGLHVNDAVVASAVFSDLPCADLGVSWLNPKIKKVLLSERTANARTFPLRQNHLVRAAA